MWSLTSVQQRMILRDSLLTRDGRNLETVARSTNCSSFKIFSKLKSYREGNQREVGANGSSIQNLIPNCPVMIMRGITIGGRNH